MARRGSSVPWGRPHERACHGVLHWIGAAKWGLLMGGLILTVDMLGLSGFTASLVITPTITVINWVAIQYFLIGNMAPESE